MTCTLDVYGGVVHNPAIALAELIAGMHDDKDALLSWLL